MTIIMRDILRIAHAHISMCKLIIACTTGPSSAVGSASNSRARGRGFDTRPGHILSFPFPLIQEGRLSVTGESMCTG